MALNVGNVHAYGDTTQRVWTSPIGGGTAPTSPLPAAIGTGWYDLGWLSDNGVTAALAQQETKKYGWQGGGIIRVLRSQFEKTFAIECEEENAVTCGLYYPGTTVTTTGATAEVQTIAITGTPTAGTFAVTLPGYGTATMLYNETLATFATKFAAATGVNIANPTGTPSTSYVVTFPVGLGNVPQMTVNITSDTGATAGAVTTGTAGVTGVNTRPVTAFSGQNLRQFAIDLVDGSGATAVHRRLYIPNGEAEPTGSVVFKGSDTTVYQFTINTYPDSSGAYYYDINDNDAVGSGLYA